MKIAILGAGAYGQVLGKLATLGGHEVVFYDPYKLPEQTLGAATKNAALVIYAAPAEAAEQLVPNLPLGVPLVCASKGFLSDFAFREFADFTALGGAGFAEDFTALLNGKATEPIWLTTSSHLAAEVLAHEGVEFEFTDDTLGIMLCGALKNVYALGAGLLGGHESDSYLQIATSEMAQILALNAADPATAQLACGAADLKLTCTPRSRNFLFGQKIARLQQQSLADQHLFGKTAPGTLRERLNLPRLAAKQTVESLNVIRSLDQCDRFLIPPSARLFITIVNQMQPLVDSLKTAHKAREHHPKTKKPLRARPGKTARERTAAKRSANPKGETHA